ncbi:uncharacterized protein LOC129599386 [Paramacrobiotus metropolitanus]|uniref:uncharacterized protein LOC129599386 n=1 Tax=Paramacrobiotus metropolitanus TaxID=2943436 RepID=UPI002446084C|nr:uncharacterized protein LOC129599386 [Paramacrobiotus metropolitanus]
MFPKDSASVDAKTTQNPSQYMEEVTVTTTGNVQPGQPMFYTQQPGKEDMPPQRGGCGFSLGESCPCCPASCGFSCC